MGGTGVAREAYSFACLSCGYGWEQAYEIERRVGVGGRAWVTYRADGVEVPSPLTRPTCRNCGEHRVRIMRAGRVAGVEAAQVRPVGHHRASSPARVHPHHWAVLHFLRRGHEGS